MARRARSAVEWQSSFRCRFSRCFFAVASVIDNSRATSLLLRPVARSRNTSRSRSVSPFTPEAECSPAAEREAMIPRATLGEMNG
jgi:hypothetical protein